MSRIRQPQGVRGSLKWIQRCINGNSNIIDEAIISKLAGTQSIDWRSPLIEDDYAEYRDGAFLARLGLESLQDRLAAFWPQRGAQWDALGFCDNGGVLLVEAKAHIAEMCSPPSSASQSSRDRIRAALAETIASLGAKPRADWIETFYQYANRLAHLYFLRKNKVPAWLVLVGFLNDDEMDGPQTPREWKAAYRLADYVLGINSGAPLMKYVIHVHPDVSLLETVG
jgi:hypothetical protein